MWAQVEERTKGYVGYLPTWTPEELEAAQAIARGQAPTLPPTSLSHIKDFVEYVHDVAKISDATGVKFSPSRAKAYEMGMEEINRKFGEAREGLVKAVAKASPPPYRPDAPPSPRRLPGLHRPGIPGRRRHHQRQR